MIQIKDISPFSVLPSFTKMPMDLSIRVGAMARLECAAEGHPSPQIAWQKHGGTDFPAARERRMHVRPEDDVFFIVDVKTEDIGVYSCTAQNTAGAISANATLTVLGEIMPPSDEKDDMGLCLRKFVYIVVSLSQKHLHFCGPSWIALWPRARLRFSSVSLVAALHQG